MYCDQDKHDQAEPLYKRVRAIHKRKLANDEKTHGRDDVHVGFCLRSYADSLRKMGRDDEAKEAGRASRRDF